MKPMDNLKTIVDDALAELQGVVSGEQAEKVAKIVEASIIRGVLEGQHRAVDACHELSEEGGDTAHKVAAAIRRKNDLLIVNLSSLR